MTVGTFEQSPWDSVDFFFFQYVSVTDWIISTALSFSLLFLSNILYILTIFSSSKILFVSSLNLLILCLDIIFLRWVSVLFFLFVSNVCVISH